MKYSGANTAHQAREILSATLNTLQSEPNIPDEVMAVAAQVAQAVGALFQAQGASDDASGKEQVLRALELLRKTLGLLQQFEPGNAGIDRTTASVAQAMGLLYPLSVQEVGPARGEPTVKLATDEADAAEREREAEAARAREAEAARQREAEAERAREAEAEAERAREAEAERERAAEAARAREEAEAAERAKNEEAAEKARADERAQEEAAAAKRAQEEEAAERERQEAEAKAKRAVESKPPVAATPLERPADTGRAEEREANIGVNTETNFYTGFTGELRDGGVFLSTYHVLPRGSWVNLLVTLPGGFDFSCRAWVRFVRDPLDLTGDAAPGMGLQFDSLSPEAEELAKRFAKKRAPFFFDE